MNIFKGSAIIICIFAIVAKLYDPHFTFGGEKF